MMRVWMSLRLVVLVLGLLSGCGSDPEPASAGGGGSGGSGGTGGTGGSGGMGNGGTGGAGGLGGGSEVPTTGSELFAYLQAGEYLDLPAETAIHDSTGPHGGKVRTFVNPILLASLEAGTTEHPIHAATVKELWGAGATLGGWAVMVKTQASSASGDGWYWYEIYSATNPANPVADGNGVGLCSNCHAAGKDYFLSPFPLQ